MSRLAVQIPVSMRLLRWQALKPKAPTVDEYEEDIWPGARAPPHLWSLIVDIKIVRRLER